MKKIIILCLLLIGLGYSVEKKALFKCNGDSYVSLLTPDTNYGNDKQVRAGMLFHYDGMKIINKEIKIGYLQYVIPQELIGKVRILDARYSFFLLSYKGISPFPPDKTIYSFGVYPCLSSWNESIVIYNGHPIASGPAFFLFSSTKCISNHFGWVNVGIDAYGLSKLQEYADTGNSYGFALYVDVLPPADSATLLMGDYIHDISIASRENGKLASYIGVSYGLKTGIIINGCNIEITSLSHIKALYK